MFDPAALLYNPAIQIDYNTHSLSELTVTDNLQTGIKIFHNDVYANAKLYHSTVTNNFGNGVETRYSFFEVAFCTLSNNRYSGFEANPTKSTQEALQLRAGIHDPLYFAALSAEQEITNLPYKLVNEGYKFLVTEASILDNPTTYMVEFEVESSHFIVVDILDWNPDTLQENLTIYDSRKSNIHPETTK